LAAFRFPCDVIVLAVRWYLRFGLSYRYVEELLAERGVEVDHVTIYRWVQRFTPYSPTLPRPCCHAVGDRWQVDETYVKVAGRRPVRLPCDRPVRAGRRRIRLSAARREGSPPMLRAGEGRDQGHAYRGTTDRAPVYPAVLEGLLPAAWHRT